MYKVSAISWVVSETQVHKIDYTKLWAIFCPELSKGHVIYITHQNHWYINFLSGKASSIIKYVIG